MSSYAQQLKVTADKIRREINFALDDGDYDNARELVTKLERNAYEQAKEYYRTAEDRGVSYS